MSIARLSMSKSVWNKVRGKVSRPSPEGQTLGKLLEQTKKSFPQEGGCVLWEPTDELKQALVNTLERDVRYSKNQNSPANLQLLAVLVKLKEGAKV